MGRIFKFQILARSRVPHRPLLLACNLRSAMYMCRLLHLNGVTQ